MSSAAVHTLDPEAGGNWPSAKQLEALMVEKEMALVDQLGAGGVAGVAAALGVDGAQGLPEHDAAGLAARQARFGTNAIETKPPTPYWQLWYDACQDGAIIVLSVMCVVTFVVWLTLEAECNPKGWMEPAALVITINVITHTTAGIDYSKERMFAALSAELDASNKKFVLRGGKPHELADKDIVVGDVVTFNAHNAASIPADGLMLGGSGVKMDESSLTGEPEPVVKTVGASPFILSGTTCSAGSGKMLVVAVGERSTSGKIKASVYGAGSDDDDEGSPLFVKIDAMSLRIGKLVMFVSGGAFLAMAVLGTMRCVEFMDYIHYAVQCITILAVAVPEGLPLAVTLSLAFSSQQMMADNNLVKMLKACETMGSATTICSDKTGTLTANRMTVRGACVAGHMLAALDPRTGGAEAKKSAGARAVEAADRGAVPKDVLALLRTLIAVDTMDESSVEPGSKEGEQAVFKGNPTECALLVFATDLGADWKGLRAETDGRSEATVARGHPFMFSSARKVMSWAVPREGGGYRVYVKGAAEIVLARCARVLSPGSATGLASVELDDATKTSFYLDQVVANFAAEAMRNIALAYKDVDAAPDGGWKATTAATKNADGSDAFVAETDLTLAAIVGIEDPLRDEVPPAIARCYGAGIDVRMCTGDNLATAVAIASRCGILRDEHFVDGKACGDLTKLKPDRAMTGKDFRRRVHVNDENGDPVFNQAAFDTIWPRLRVMARCDPEDKNTLAHGLNKSLLFQDTAKVAQLKRDEGITIFPDRQVVAMTGDGTNDAPALKRADVGFAMGISGTQIAKDAADIILLDDNFASIVTAAKWGRNVFESICKFLQFQLTVNIAAIVCAVVGAFRYQESPIAAVQMLWINLIMDSLASLALATEPPADTLLDRPPVNRSDSIISEQMLYNMVGHAVYQVIVCMFLYFPTGPRFLGCDDGAGGHHAVDNGHFPSCNAPDDDHAVEYNATGVHADDDDCVVKENSVHYTCIFNAFVMMTLFNEINCRKLGGETNVFDGIFKNAYFCGIWLLTMAFQVLGVAFLGNFLQVAEGKYMFGINAWQWLVCLLAGVGEIPWQQLINLVKRATSEKPGGGTRGGKFESGVLKFGSGRVWLHERTVQNTSAVRDVASSKRLLAKSSKSQSYHAKSA